jgi:hypothetical protein
MKLVNQLKCQKIMLSKKTKIFSCLILSKSIEQIIYVITYTGTYTLEDNANFPLALYTSGKYISLHVWYTKYSISHKIGVKIL